MSLVPGTRLGPYEITAKLGEGGMGVVFRATDSQLGREVALKVLPAGLTSDPERLQRFEREAKLLAQLNHPNIAQIYGLETSGDSRALVMELVEGPTLAERLEAGPLSFTESLSIGLQITQALEEAHEKGIVHRDLKPQNIKAPSEGKTKVLDFGLAKAMDPGGVATGSTSPLALSPTLTLGATQMGMILGTAAYMAPEQAKGMAVDKRADVWAFGVVLVEMLTGQSLFVGDSVPDTLARVLQREIDFSVLPASTPPALRRLLRRLLERNPGRRLHDIADARIVLEDLVAGRMEEDGAESTAAARTPQRPGALHWLPWSLAALAALAAAAVVVLNRRGASAAPPRALRFHVAPPESSTPTRRGSSFELSPDGRFLAITAAGELWVRPLDAVSARRLEGIEDATYPFWSPDGGWLGFFADGELMKISRDGGRPLKICDAPEGRGASWGPDGEIIFSDRFGSPGLSRVSAQGGQPVALTRTPGPESNQYHRYPQFLPDGRSFLYQHLAASPELAGIYVATLDGGPPKRVLEGADQAIYVPRAAGAESGHLLFRRDETLMAQPFSPGKRRTEGGATAVADSVGGGPNTGSGAFSASANGVLAHSDTVERSGELVWSDRSGKRLDAVNSETRELVGIALARGERHVAFGAMGTGNQSDIWIQALPGGEPSRFTFGPAPGWGYPLWSPDGSELAYTTFDLVGMPRYEIRRRRADRAGVEETLVSAPTTIYPWDWSPDGRSLLYGDEKSDLWLLPLAGDRKAVAFLAAPGRQVYAQFSPDGRLVAYASDEQGQLEVFVGTVPPSGALWQLSAGGGTMPRWRRDGRELYFRAPDGTLMAIALGAGIDGREAPRPLFVGIPSSGNTPIFTYSPADDGQRFLVAASRSESQPPITLVVNWQAALATAASPVGSPP